MNVRIQIDGGDFTLPLCELSVFFSEYFEYPNPRKVLVERIRQCAEQEATIDYRPAETQIHPSDATLFDW